MWTNGYSCYGLVDLLGRHFVTVDQMGVNILGVDVLGVEVLKLDIMALPHLDILVRFV